MHMLDKLWKEADDQYELLKAGSDDPEQKGFLKGRLRGLCFALLNYYGGATGLKTEDDIARMIVSRNKIGCYREGGDQTIPGNRFFQEPPAKRAVKIPAHLSESDIADIKSSSFPIELLASTYDITPTMVKAIQSQG